jgi:GNAT superfamily N-acetyltransferase
MIRVYPLTSDRWKDFESLFGKKGGCAGCWCTYWRLTREEHEAGKGEGNQKKIRTLLTKGRSIGILAYDKGIAVGWCSVAPREDFPRLNRSRVLSKLDEKPVWSVVCFFIHKDYRNKGLSVHLLKAAIDYVKAKRGRIIEGYPIDPAHGKYPPAFAWTGFLSAFEKVGFQEIARRSPTRPIVRFYLS